MRLRVGNRAFAPRCVGARRSPRRSIAAFVALGTWQLDRAREKQALIEAFERGTADERRLSVGAAWTSCRATSTVRRAVTTSPRTRSCSTTCRRAPGQPGLSRADAVRPAGQRRSCCWWIAAGCRSASSRSRLPDVTVTGEPREPSRPPRRSAGARRAHRRGGRAEGDRPGRCVLQFPVASPTSRRRSATPVESRIVLLDAAPPGRIRARLAPADRIPARAAPRLRDAVVRPRRLALVVVFVAMSLAAHSDTRIRRRP